MFILGFGTDRFCEGAISETLTCGVMEPVFLISGVITTGLRSDGEKTSADASAFAGALMLEGIGDIWGIGGIFGMGGITGSGCGI